MSETFRHQYQTPDHILLPASLFDTSGLSYADSSFRVFTWSKRLLYYGAPYRWQMRFQGKQKTHKGEGYSDHLPIMVKLCRNSFVRAKDTVVRKEIPGRKTISIRAGFESSCEGWVAGEPKIHVMRDTVAPAVGHYCLKIAGQAGKQNGCAARVLLHCSNAHPANCRLRIKGSGEFSFRMRPKESEKWTYYTGPDFKPAQAGKYSVYDFKEWTQLYLLIIDTIPDNKDYELEIRVKKESTVCIWLDTVVLQQS
jgi:hypothetical protein